MSIEGGFSWFVLIPIITFGIIIYSIYSDITLIKVFATIIAGVYGLNECFKYRWLE